MNLQTFLGGLPDNVCSLIYEARWDLRLTDDRRVEFKVQCDEARSPANFLIRFEDPDGKVTCQDIPLIAPATPRACHTCVCPVTGKPTRVLYYRDGFFASRVGQRLIDASQMGGRKPLPRKSNDAGSQSLTTKQLHEALSNSGGSRARAAASLGLSVRTVQRGLTDELRAEFPVATRAPESALPTSHTRLMTDAEIELFKWKLKHCIPFEPEPDIEEPYYRR